MSENGKLAVNGKRERRKFPVLAVAVMLVLALLGVYAIVSWSRPTSVLAQGQREFWLNASAKQITLSPGNVWDAWTYEGTVPGPTLRIRVGDLVTIHFRNDLDLRHSIHLHGLRYSIENDGSQAYPDSMPGPGASYTYRFEATRPGLFYYHCHSSDGGFPINYHILKGLYGAIVVYPADEWPPKTDYEFVQFFGEAMMDPGIAYNINGAQAREHDLMDLIETNGYAATVDALKGLGIPVVPVGQQLTFYLVGIGNEYHSWHLHGGNPVYVNGEAIEGDVVPLGPGTAVTAKVTLTYPGIWLIHCHLVAHADGGMVTLVIAE